MQASKANIIDLVALILLIVGGVNWGLVGAFKLDLVMESVGRLSEVLARIVYVIVGLCAIYLAVRSPALAHLKRPHVAHPGA